MKKISLFIALAVIIGLSSCSTLRLDKRHHSRGWYVDFGTDKKSEATIVKEETEEAPAVVNEEQSEEEPASTLFSSNKEGTTQQAPVAIDGETSIVVSPTEESGSPVVAESDSQSTPTTAENVKEAKPLPRSASDDRMILLVILAIFIPPLAVYLKQGVTPMFWITLICWLIGGAFLFGRFGYGYVGGLGLLAIVLALLVVFDVL